MGGESRIVAELGRPVRKAVAPFLSRCPRFSVEAGTALRAEEIPPGLLLVVETGSLVVATEAAPAARRTIVAVVGQGELLPRPASGEVISALEDAELTALTEEGLQALLGVAGGALAIIRALGERTRECHRSLAVFGLVSHRERVREKLLQLAREHGKVIPGGVVIGLPLTHLLLAEMIGSARETVTAALRQLEAEGFVSREGRDYRLAVLPEDL